MIIGGIWGMLCVVTSCGDSSREIGNVVVMEKPEFPEAVSPSDNVIELNSIMNIAEWGIDNDKIICRSEQSDNIFYYLDPETLCTIDSAYTKGEGPDEFIIPRLLKSSRKRAISADLAKGEFKGISLRDSYDTYSANSLNGFINSPVDIRYPLIGYTKLDGNARKWMIYDLEKKESVDSVVYDQDDAASIPSLDFSAASNGENSVIACHMMDELSILRHDEYGKIKSQTILKGNGAVSPMQPYYVDVACGSNAFYVLSMSHMKFADNINPEGFSCIEVYDYDGNAKSLLKLNFFPAKILLDEDRERMMILSATDDSIHVIGLSELTLNS